jgi:hypothetical protein
MELTPSSCFGKENLKNVILSTLICNETDIRYTTPTVYLLLYCVPNNKEASCYLQNHNGEKRTKKLTLGGILEQQSSTNPGNGCTALYQDTFCKRM